MLLTQNDISTLDAERSATRELMVHKDIEVESTHAMIVDNDNLARTQHTNIRRIIFNDGSAVVNFEVTKMDANSWDRDDTKHTVELRMSLQDAQQLVQQWYDTINAPVHVVDERRNSNTLGKYPISYTEHGDVDIASMLAE